MTLDEGIVTESELAGFIDGLGDAAATDAWLLSQMKAKGTGGGTRAGEALTVLNDVVQSKTRLNDEHRARLMESILRVGDVLASVDDTERTTAMFPIKNDLRVIWVLRGLIEGVRETPRRVSMLVAAYEHGSAYITMLELARSLGYEHGLYGDKKERGEMALVDKDTCLSLASGAVAKVRDEAAKGLLRPVGNPMDLARIWAELGDKAEAVNWLRSVCTADDTFLAAVRGAVSESHSWGMGFVGMGDRVVRTTLRADVEYLCSFFDPIPLRDRVNKLLQNEALITKLDKETVFGLGQLRDRIRNDGSTISEKDGFDRD
jgi:hypothetical protein